MRTRTTHVDTLIIGAGLSGIGTACHLARKFPERSLAILERRERVGGTWDLFRYPDIRSDSDMFTFGYEFRPWHDLKVLSDGSAIQKYVEDTAAEFDVLDKVQFGVKVLTAAWSSADSRWTITSLHEATGETRVVTASFLISCTGYDSHDAGYQHEFAGIDAFTETGIRLKSGDEIEADVIVTATGLNIEMLGGIELTIDGEQRRFEDQLTYQATLIEGIPNFGWVFGYTNAPWTLKSDIAANYLCRLLAHMEENGHTVVVPRDTDDESLGIGMLDALQSGYVQRAKQTLPRQGRSGPWQVRMHYGQDKKMLIEEPVADRHLQFSASRTLVSA